ncbi:unnamed protein product [Bursaphelenchus xylophilus]|uniref:(pine wood nematode) hypothetical protein n=1 Tax=Bursaphelenchus xylophilus TaxID=6326 RepID=A0A811MA92_BURXY|nr:unnamed protein product [Bursaphelenchus xylophilus]CAG9132670.1 unnamed protein product [Bursaphelenchus xylophilus]
MTRGLYNKITELDNVTTNVSRFYLATKEGGFGYASLQQVFVEAVVSRAIYCLRAPSLCDIREFILSKFDPVKVARIALARSKIDMDIERMDMASATRTIRQHYQAKWKTLFQQSKLYQKWVQHKIDIPNSKDLWGVRTQTNNVGYAMLGIETASHIVTECSYTPGSHVYRTSRLCGAEYLCCPGKRLRSLDSALLTAHIVLIDQREKNYPRGGSGGLVCHTAKADDVTRKLYKYGVNGEYQS